MTREEAERVKVSHFTKQGFSLNGVVHVGANDGYEIPFYFGLDVHRVIAFEPLQSVIRKLDQQFGEDVRVEVYPFALSDVNGEMTIRIPHHLHDTPERDTKCATGLKMITERAIGIGWTPTQWDEEEVAIRRFDSLNINLTGLDTLVIDVQGMEHQVLRGFGAELLKFSFLNIECSRVPVFEGESPASEIIEFLAGMGFDQDSPIEDHDDIMFIKRGLK